MLQRLGVFSVVLFLFLGESISPVHAVSWVDGGPDKLWTTTNNWQFGNNPANNAVTIGNHIDAKDDTTLVDQFYAIDSLTLNNGADVVLSPNGGSTSTSLVVNGLTNVMSGTDTSVSNIILYDAPLLGSSFVTQSMNLSTGGRVTLDSGSDTTSDLAILTIADGNLTLDSGESRGTLFGNGLVHLADSAAVPTSLLINDGTITAGEVNPPLLGPPSPSTLQIVADDLDARFDWDGTFDAGELNVNGNATLDIDVQPGNGILFAAFDGTMNLKTGSTIDIAHLWTFGKSSSSANGLINVDTPSYGIVPIGQDPNPGAPARIAGANWTMANGTINIDNTWDSLQIDSPLNATGGTIANAGTIIFNHATSIQSTADFNMTGDHASLVINAGVNIATPDFNLDGEGQVDNHTTINAGGVLNLGLGFGADEDFHHTITLNGGQLQVATLDDDWSLANTGELYAKGGGTSIISGETFHIDGEIEVSENSTLDVNAHSVYNSGSSLTVEAGSRIDHQTATYDGGTYVGAGILRKGNATIVGPTTWNVDIVDLDDGDTTLDADLTINANQIDELAGNGMGKLITISDQAKLEVNMSGDNWKVSSNGSIVYNGSALASNFLEGSNVVLDGSLVVNGHGRTNAILNIMNSGSVEINSGGILRLAGGDLANPNTIAGGTIGGQGTLRGELQASLHGFGTIHNVIDFASIFNNLIAEDGGLYIVGSIVDVATLGTNGPSAVLSIQNQWNTNVADRVILNGGVLEGNHIINDGVNGIDGFGEVTAKIINNSILAANGGTMVYSNSFLTDHNDWDGTNDTGQIVADQGNIELQANANALFNGTVNVDFGQELFVNGFQFHFGPSSTLLLRDGTYRATNPTNIGGTLNVKAGGDSLMQISATATFQNGSATTLVENLLLDNTETVIEQGATFSGGGVLVNNPGRTLRLLDGASVDVLLENHGTLALGSSPGQTSGLDFQQGSNGVWEVEIGGLGLKDYDRMNLTGLAALDGILDLSLILGFAPTLGDTFTILSTIGGVSGTFDSILQPSSMPSGLMFGINYLGSMVQLEIINAISGLAGDYNQDGIVNAADYTVWLSSLGKTGVGLVADGNGDGTVNQGDYLVWKDNFGNSASVSSETIQVPEPSTLLLVGLAVGIGLLMPSRKKVDALN